MEPERPGEARRHRAARLIQEAADRIAAARRLLEAELDDMEDGRESYIALGASPIALFGLANEHMAVAQLNAALAIRGQTCARLLLRLMAEPDRLIPLDELALVLNRGAHSRAAIKVHISTLRTALAEKGIAGTAIETGQRSYGLRAAMLPALLSVLQIGRFEAQPAGNESNRDK